MNAMSSRNSLFIHSVINIIRSSIEIIPAITGKTVNDLL
jgi:hypothetical protein